MPQNGFHGLVGLVAARFVARRVPRQEAEPLVAGTVFGAMLPDVDMYPTAVAFLMGRKDLIYVIHRSLTHSLAFVLVLLLAGALSRRSAWRFGLWGLGIGVATHVLLDLFLWFAQLDLFWPLSHLPAEQPLLPIADLWRSASVPHLLTNIREAMEFAAFALLLLALGRIGVQSRHLGHAQLLAWILFAATLATAFVFREKPGIQNVIVFAPYLLFFLPFCWLQVWNHRSVIAEWALAAKGGSASRADEPA